MGFQCLKAFYDSRHAILKYLTTFPADVDEENSFVITSLIKEFERKPYDPLQVLTELVMLSTILQARDLDLFTSYQKIFLAKSLVESIEFKTEETELFTREMMKHFNSRFPVQEATVFSIMNLKNVYPDEVVLKKFELFERQFSFVSSFTNPEAVLVWYWRKQRRAKIASKQTTKDWMTQSILVLTTLTKGKRSSAVARERRSLKHT